LTIDASDGDRWQYVSLAHGRVLAPPDTADWDLAVQRYRVRTAGALADAGAVPFEHAARPHTGGGRRDLGHWYRYNMLTHLLEPDGHVYFMESRAGGPSWKLAVLSYYCPGLVAGCLTVRYAPVEAEPAGASTAPARRP
jgi:hypothetical protein